MRGTTFEVNCVQGAVRKAQLVHVKRKHNTANCGQLLRKQKKIEKIKKKIIKLN